MRNFFRTVPLVVAVILCLLCELPVVSASGLHDSLDVVDMESENDSDSSGSASASGADVHIDFQNNSMLAVSSVVSDDSDDLSRSSSSDPDGSVQGVLLALFGSYTPRTQVVTTYFNGEVVSTEEQVVPGVAGLDFEWLVSVGLFALMLWCLFRFLGGVVEAWII